MAGGNFTTPSTPFSFRNFTGGLNTTAGSLGLDNSESSDLRNVLFNKFGSIVKRNGYTHLNSTAISSAPTNDGLHWYEAVLSGTLTRKMITVADGKLWKMDDLDGTWDNITGALTITEGNFCDFENFLNEVYITNNVDVPFKWSGSGNGAAMTVPTNLTKAKFVKQYNNYLFLANVTVSGTVHQSRIYWSNIKTTGTWTDTDFIEVAKDDGQDITGLKVLSDRLVIYKSRSIYNLLFTGDSDIPFILPGGGKSNSAVGCVAPFSIQEMENGHIFLSHDGWYFYDGNNSYKISEKITTSLLETATTRLAQARSMVQKSKNLYFCALPSSGQTENDTVFVFDIFNNAWSIYSGMAPSSMATAYVDGVGERIYFGDYNGYVYRADTGSDDYPLKVQTAINFYYKTNWMHFDDLVDQKGVPHIYLYYQTSNSVLTLSYAYDFEDGDQFSNTVNLSGGTSAYGSAVWDTSVYASSGGKVQRRDLTGRGRVIRFTFSNSTLSETVQIDGLGVQAHLETNV